MIRFIFVLVCLICFPSFVSAQEKVSIYFQFGSARIPKEQKSALDKLPGEIDFSAVDSIQFIGLADSVGKANANFKLSEKRATTVLNYLFKSLPVHVPVTVKALGEDVKSDPAEGRRVDIIFYSNTDEELVKDAEEVVDREKDCFTRDFNIRTFCYVRTVDKKKKKRVIIETEMMGLKRSRVYYAAKTNSEGEMVARKVSWKKKRTGRYWWEKERLVYELPKEDYDDYGLMIRSEAPCDSCSFEYHRKNYVKEWKHFLADDIFLMNNIQYKKLFLRPRQVQIRLPKDYVDERVGYSLVNGGYKSRFQVAHWDTKRGKKKQMYFYSNVRVRNGEMPTIQRSVHYVNCYYFEGQPKRGVKPWYCRLRNTKWSLFSLSDLLEAMTLQTGLNYHEEQFQPYVAAGLMVNRQRYRWALLGGTDHQLGFYGSASVAANLNPFWQNEKKITSSWMAPTRSIKKATRLAHLYIGTELKMTRNNKSSSYTEQNLHLGIAFLNYRKSDKLLRFFIQGRAAYDHSQYLSNTFYPSAEIGVSFQLFHGTSNSDKTGK